LDLPKDLRKALEAGNGPQPVAIVDGWVAADDLAGSDIAGDSGLGGRDGAIADAAVPGDADLAGKNDVLADVRGAGEPDLGA